MTRDDIIRMARECQMPHFYQTGEIANLERLTRFAALVAAAEREECAKVCENIGDYDENVDEYYSDIYAYAIRARGEKT
jgi:hypothetical protein